MSGADWWWVGWSLLSISAILFNVIFICVAIKQRYSSFAYVQGRTEKLKRGGGRILRKINCFCEILNKMSQKKGGGRRTVALPLCTPMIPCIINLKLLIGCRECIKKNLLVKKVTSYKQRLSVCHFIRFFHYLS